MESLGYSLAAVYALLWIFGIALLFVWPALVFFAVWRGLRDLRRITNAIESIARPHDSALQTGPVVGTFGAALDAAQAARREQPTERHITLSMFGR